MISLQVPAVIYLCMNVLGFVSLNRIDAGTFAVIQQTKIFFTAFFQRIFLARVLSQVRPRQLSPGPRAGRAGRVGRRASTLTPPHSPSGALWSRSSSLSSSSRSRRGATRASHPRTRSASRLTT